MITEVDKKIIHRRTQMGAKLLELFSIVSLFYILTVLVHNSENLIIGFKYLFYFIGSYLTLYRGLCIIEKILEICSSLSRLKQSKEI